MKGILFKPEMIKAIMEGRKTMTRRTGGIEEIDPMATEIVYSDQFGKGNFVARFPYKDCDPIRYEVTNILKPKYKVGEVIYVKEPWSTSFNGKGHGWDKDAWDIIYKLGSTYYYDEDGPVKWKNAMFMPASAARTFLKITNVRVEKLGEITGVEILKEGIGMCYNQWLEKVSPDWMPLPVTPVNWDQMQKAEWELVWRTINKSYDPNSWLFVYEFEVVDNPKL